MAGNQRTYNDNFLYYLAAGSFVTSIVGVYIRIMLEKNNNNLVTHPIMAASMEFSQYWVLFLLLTVLFSLLAVVNVYTYHYSEMKNRRKK